MASSCAMCKDVALQFFDPSLHSSVQTLYLRSEGSLCVCVCVHAYVRVCVRAYVRVCVCD